MRITETIAFRLFLLIASVQTVILVALTFAAVRIQQNHLIESVTLSAARVSEVIARSTRYSMLLNRKEDVHNIISSIGGGPGIEGIRIYNKQGVVIFATDPPDIHTTVDMNAEACVICHHSNVLDHPHPSSEGFSRMFSKPGGERVMGLITPIRNEQQCSDAACHSHPADKTILGVLDVKMNLAHVDERLAQSTTQLLMLSGAAVLLVSGVSGLFIWGVVRRPVRKLIHGMEQVATGRLDQKLEAGSRNEFGQLATSFNEMTTDLRKAREELTAWSSTLEQRVKEKTADLEKAHKRMLGAERMSSLGKLAATVAHELNNPLEGILTFARLLMKRAAKLSMSPEQLETITSELRLVADEAQRCGNIVRNMLVFSRQSGGMFQKTEIKPIIDRCELLMRHHAYLHNVALRTECPSGISLDCDSAQIQQTVVALIVNAIEAVSVSSNVERRVEISVTERSDVVEIRVSDTGIGMTEEVNAHIFEPFYTTKTEGKGVGLGLAVVFGIVQRHNGTINVESSPGCGTTFTLTLPKEQTVPETGSGSSASYEGIHL